MNKLSPHKFANERVERNLIKFWITGSKIEVNAFKKILKIFPICVFEDGIFSSDIKKIFGEETDEK